MTNKGGIEIAEKWRSFQDKLRKMGCLLESPFMTLSFMALVVIPELKIGEKDCLNLVDLVLFLNCDFMIWPCMMII